MKLFLSDILLQLLYLGYLYVCFLKFSCKVFLTHYWKYSQRGQHTSVYFTKMIWNTFLKIHIQLYVVSFCLSAAFGCILSSQWILSKLLALSLASRLLETGFFCLISDRVWKRYFQSKRLTNLIQWTFWLTARKVSF